MQSPQAKNQVRMRAHLTREKTLNWRENRQQWPKLRFCEIDREVPAISTFIVKRITDTDFCDFWAEDVVTVNLAVHPPCKRALSVAAKGRIPAVDVFAGIGISIALGFDAGKPGGAIRANMVDEIIARHVIAVHLSSRG